jgi:potassium inwardly-rectifying channel subfamily J
MYSGSWLFFAVGWYLIVYIHGDTVNVDNPDWKSCVSGIQNFTSAFLFSAETQHTTGYGFYHLTEECPTAILLFCIQSIFGVILEGLLVGLIFTKMSRAKKRSQTLMFSNNSVIIPRDGVLHFMFRIADMRKSHLLEAHVRAQLVRKRTTKEGETITYHQEELKVDLIFLSYI